ncbi:hypothetical protein ABID22_002510 [Pontibacter aydingkolensis]|uniref:Membrane domain of glycerophosphoryl diester phosphodiesterase n=1 Tax=Pontibacter aydingkolensis TaxID=1911536 RepID=A0ABS7CWB4_9BACT|nr:hypothetical protein [Pontibacter aydingkolensis]MBW7468158.1 hypothetical protein [Pontibacter aydingkolensis]
MYQTSQKINLRQERDFGEKLNATFHFIKHNLKPLSRALLLYVTPVALMAGIFSGLYQARLFQSISGTGDYRSYGEFSFFQQVTSLNYIVMLFFTMLGYIMVSLVVYSFIVVYMDSDDEVSPAAVWEHIKVNMVQAIYAGIGIGLVCFFGFFLLGFGLYLGVVCSLFFMVMIREELGVIESVERCFYLIKHNWWATFGFLLIVAFIQGMIGWLAALPAGIITMLRMLEVPGVDSDVLLVAANTISSVFNIYISCITMVAIAFQYFHLVEQKDGIGWMEQVNLIGKRDSHTFKNEGDF